MGPGARFSKIRPDNYCKGPGKLILSLMFKIAVSIVLQIIYKIKNISDESENPPRQTLNFFLQNP